MTITNRRVLIAMGMVAVAASAVPAHAAQSERSEGATGVDAMGHKGMSTYLVLYRRGPRWAAGVPMRDQQGIREHFKYYLDLHRNGRLRQAGGFPDDSGGAAVFDAADEAAAAAFVAADPAVTSGTFEYELKRWNPVPWEDVSKKWAERGQ